VALPHLLPPSPYAAVVDAGTAYQPMLLLVQMVGYCRVGCVCSWAQKLSQQLW